MFFCFAEVMLMGILIFFVGFFVGAVIGGALMALCVAGRYHDEIYDETDREGCE